MSEVQPEFKGDFIPLLTTIDWNQEWKARQIERKTADSCEYWDKRAETFSCKDAPSHYVTEFIKFCQLDDNDVVFDMGCGNGALALPFAKAGHKVIARDFSRGMLDTLQRDAQAAGIDSLIDIQQMAWADNWEDFGITDGCADVAIASRSIATADLEESLLKLDAAARKRVCITVTCGASPRADERLLAAVGLRQHLGSDFLYAFNILARNGIHPEIRYIKSERLDTFDSYDEALEALGRMVCDVARDPEQHDECMKKLAVWLQDELVDNPEAGQSDGHHGVQGKLRLKFPRVTYWAFISWEKLPN